MSLKKRFILFSAVFALLAGAFLALMEHQTDRVKVVRRHIKDDWAETKLLFEMTVLLGQLHALFDEEEAKANQPRIDHLLEYYGQLQNDLRSHALKDTSNQSGELKEISALEKLETNLDDWQNLAGRSNELSASEQQLVATRLFQEGSVAVTSFSHGAWEEMDESLTALGQSENEIERMTFHWTAGMLGLLGVAWIGFVYWLMRPISRLRRMVRRLRERKVMVHEEIRDTGEVGELMRSFVEMAEELRQFTTNLEELVAARTLELERSRAALASAQKLAAIGRLSSGIAHEINNPLTAIGACAEGMMKRMNNGSTDTELFESYLRTIHEEVYRCKEITEKLLDFSRQRPDQPTLVDICDVVRGAAKLVEPLAVKKQVAVEMKLPESCVTYSFGHPIKQVLLNLLMNALEACDKDGKISITLGSSPDAIEIAVRDNGIGITKEDLPHLFEPFYTRRRDNNGTGLGLFVCEGIVQALGGTLSATSDGAGKGATFVFVLPARRPENPRLEESVVHA